MTRVVAGVLEALVAIVGAGCALAPWGVILFAPWAAWMRGVVLLGFAVVVGAVWMLVPWPSGWGGWRDFYAFGPMLAVVAGVLSLLWAAIAACVS